MPFIRYGRSDDAWRDYDSALRTLILSRKLKRICEVGGGANPALPWEFLATNHLDCTLLDVSPTELAKAPTGYPRIVGDICDAGVRSNGAYDLVFSKMLAEHVVNASLFHHNVRRLLADGGFAAHLFPTLYALPFLVNKLIPERLACWLLARLAPRDQTTQRKFPAYYRWCRGPTSLQIERLRQAGFALVEYAGFFGHWYYARIPGVRALHRRATSLLVRHPNAYLTSFAYVVLRKV